MSKNLHFYYFSGTGNSYHVCKQIEKKALELGYKSELTNISKINRKSIQPSESDTLIGFVSPTHGFNFPPIMMHFLFRFPKGKRNQVFLVNTRAGMKMGEWFLPGLSGTAQYFYALLLKMKGYNVLGMQCIDLPSNWISLHPGIKEKVVHSIIERCDKRIDIFAEKILHNEKSYRALRDLPQDILISPVSVLYYIFGRFFFAKSFYANKNCNRCDSCIKTCPVNAIKIIDNRPYWTHHCESCMLCMNNCPQRAIQTAHGFIAGLAYIVYILLTVLIYSRVKDEYNFLSTLTNHPVAHPLITNIVLLCTLFIGYRLFHFLLKFGVFEKLINYTSLTYFKFWRRYKFKPKK